VSFYLDAAAIGGSLPAGRQGICSYQGRSPYTREVKAEKSAEAIVVVEYELRTDTAEDSQINEGLNIKMLFQMQHGSLETGSHAISGTGQNRQRKMIEQILNRRNIMRAYYQVLSNKGSAGVDGMQVKDCSIFT